jgi:hypothetical protein
MAGPTARLAMSNDTSAAAEAEQIAVYRRMGGQARVATAFRLSGLVRATAIAGIKRRHPEYDDARAERAYTYLVLGEELMHKAFPDQELVHP